VHVLSDVLGIRSGTEDRLHLRRFGPLQPGKISTPQWGPTVRANGGQSLVSRHLGVPIKLQHPSLKFNTAKTWCSISNTGRPAVELIGATATQPCWQILHILERCFATSNFSFPGFVCRSRDVFRCGGVNHYSAFMLMLLDPNFTAPAGTVAPRKNLCRVWFAESNAP